METRENGVASVVSQSATSTPADASLIGRVLAGKYRVERQLGAGAMGAVYRASQLALDKWVAIKILHAEVAQKSNLVERFKIEALSASRLDHPNSLRVLDFGDDDGLLDLVMEYVEGEDLLSVMEREWPFDPKRVAAIVSQALAALGMAHDLGIVHRDLKPENILVLHGRDDEENPIRCRQGLRFRHREDGHALERREAVCAADHRRRASCRHS